MRSLLHRVLRALPAVLLAVASVVTSTARPAAADQITLTYEIGAAGDVSTSVDAFADHVRSTLEDAEGWSLGGSIDWVAVADDADVEILIAEPSRIGQIPGCSAEYSCHVSGTVYINEERWNEGAAGWHVGLDAYRHYVVTHEVGHYLGLDHVDCPGSGEPAPAMQQQTIETEPCVNRVWPLPYERDLAADRYDVTVDDRAYAGEIAIVDAVYPRTLVRQPGPGTARNWAEPMDRDDLTTAGLIDIVYASPEFDSHARAIARLYAAAFGRMPDIGGFYDWTGARVAGRSLDSIAQDFATSAEFEKRYGETDVGEYVDRLYQNVLGRQPDTEGRDNWVEALESGELTRGEVLVGFSESPEHRQKIVVEADVALLYLTLLDRSGDAEGRDNWERQLEAGMPRIDVIDAFLDSGESVV